MKVRFLPDTLEDLVTHYFICYALVPHHPSEYTQSTLHNVVVAEHPFDWLAREQLRCNRQRTERYPAILSWQTLTLADLQAIKRSSAVAISH
jgi:hypothetical protein